MALAATGCCKVVGCDRERRTRGWCAAHYNQWRINGEEPSRPFTDFARFYRYVAQAGDDDCWLWVGTIKRRTGYGQFWFDGAPRRAHQMSYLFSNGQIPDGMVIRHTCDVKACANPRHLILGTPLENARDAVDRGLYPRGESQGRSKLTVRQVSEIRKGWVAGRTQVEMARYYGVSRSAIQWILNGRTWAGIGEGA